MSDEGGAFALKPMNSCDFIRIEDAISLDAISMMLGLPNFRLVYSDYRYFKFPLYVSTDISDDDIYFIDDEDGSRITSFERYCVYQDVDFNGVMYEALVNEMRLSWRAFWKYVLDFVKKLGRPVSPKSGDALKTLLLSECSFEFKGDFYVDVVIIFCKRADEVGQSDFSEELKDKYREEIGAFFEERMTQCHSVLDWNRFCKVRLKGFAEDAPGKWMAASESDLELFIENENIDGLIWLIEVCPEEIKEKVEKALEKMAFP